MYKQITLVLTVFFLSVFSAKAQEELNALVTVNADKVQSSNKQVYTTLQRQISEFINRTKWTDNSVLAQEKINCAFTIIVNSQQGNTFSASLQIQSARPVYGSSYETPILNINDQNFNFVYNEFQPLVYNPNSFENNLVSTLTFYVYMILGVDADTFALKGGKSYFKKAESVVLQAQQSGDSAWENEIGKQNRFLLVDSFVDSKFDAIHSILYSYHRKGLDYFESDELSAKKEIANAVLSLKKLHNITIGNYLIRVFLDAKSTEIVEVFSNGKRTNKELKLKEVLQKIAATQGDKWKKIKA